MKRHLLVGLVAAALALTANVGFALPISIIDQGDTVWDQNTNQDWLALDTVAPCSQADLDDATFGCEFLADGWTLASLTEVDAFLENVGLTPGSSLEPGLINLALELINILGPTIVVIDGSDSDFQVSEIAGITSTPSGTDDQTVRFVAFFETNNPSKSDFLEIGAFPGQPEFGGGPVISYWLSRSHVEVPEPGTLALLGLGLAGLGLTRRRRTA